MYIYTNQIKFLINNFHLHILSRDDDVIYGKSVKYIFKFRLLYN